MDKKRSLGNKTSTSKESLNDSFYERSSSRSNSYSSFTTSASVSMRGKTDIAQFLAFHNSNEIDRLVSDQGLIKPKERPTSSSRRVRDKSYYKGLIYIKAKEVGDEIKKLRKEINLLSMERSMFLPYKKKAESKANELQNLSEVLADFNLLEDMLNRDIEVCEAKEELKYLQASNEKESGEVEKLFNLTKQQEKIVKKLESDLKQENFASEIPSPILCFQMHEKCKMSKHIDEQLNSKRIELEKDLRHLTEEKERLEFHCSQKSDLEQALELVRKLWQAESKKNDFISKNENGKSASEEQEYLLKYESEYTYLLARLNQETQDIETQITKLKNDLKAVKNENPSLPIKNSPVSDNALIEQKKNEALQTEKQKLEENIIDILKEMSKKLYQFKDTNPNMEENSYSLCNTDVKLELSRMTTEFNRLSNLEFNLSEDLKSLKDEKAVKEKEMDLFFSFENKKESLERHKKYLLKHLKSIKKQKIAWDFLLSDRLKLKEKLENQLHSNDKHTELLDLEKKWQSIERENFALKSYIQSNGPNYLLVKDQVRELYLEFNKLLQNP